MPTIQILLSTYNGERYLQQQIYSLIYQTYSDWELLARDDGSNDNTLNLLKKFSATDNRIQIINDNLGNLKPARAFMELLRISTAEYVMFCDQDDIWLPKKIEKMVDAISKKDNTAPQVILTNAYLYSETKEKMYGKAVITYPTKLRDFLFQNAGTIGNSILMNRIFVVKCLPSPQVIAMHDHYICFIAILCNATSILDENLMLYRQHQEQVTGPSSGSHLGKIRHFFLNKKSVIDKLHYEAIQSYVYNNVNISITANDRKIIEAYIRYPQVNILWRLLIIIAFRFSVVGNVLFLLLKTITRKPI